MAIVGGFKSVIDNYLDRYNEAADRQVKYATTIANAKLQFEQQNLQRQIFNSAEYDRNVQRPLVASNVDRQLNILSRSGNIDDNTLQTLEQRSKTGLYASQLRDAIARQDVAALEKLTDKKYRKNPATGQLEYSLDGERFFAADGLLSQTYKNIIDLGFVRSEKSLADANKPAAAAATTPATPGASAPLGNEGRNSVAPSVSAAQSIANDSVGAYFGFNPTTGQTGFEPAPNSTSIPFLRGDESTPYIDMSAYERHKRVQGQRAADFNFYNDFYKRSYGNNDGGYLDEIFTPEYRRQQ